MQNQKTWKPVAIEPFNTAYEINPQGDVRTIKSGKILKPGRPNSSSPFVILAHKQVDNGRHPYTVKKLVALTFGDQPAEPKRPEIDWTSTQSMLSELNFLRQEAGKSALKRWSESKEKLKSALQKLLN